MKQCRNRISLKADKANAEFGRVDKGCSPTFLLNESDDATVVSHPGQYRIDPRSQGYHARIKVRTCQKDTEATDHTDSVIPAPQVGS